MPSRQAAREGSEWGEGTGSGAGAWSTTCDTNSAAPLSHVLCFALLPRRPFLSEAMPPARHRRSQIPCTDKSGEGRDKALRYTRSLLTLFYVSFDTVLGLFRQGFAQVCTAAPSHVTILRTSHGRVPDASQFLMCVCFLLYRMCRTCVFSSLMHV